MKKLTYILFSIALLALASCNGYLDRSSKTQMNDENYWSSETNIRLFVNGGYNNYFTGYNSSWSQQYAPGVYSSGEFSDERTTTGKQTSTRQAVPEDNWYRNEGTNWLYQYASAPWNFGWVRKWNTLMDRLDMMKEQGKLKDEPYNHWMGVARFLRAFEYSRLVVTFGDVPYYDEVVGSADLDSQFKPRDPRTTVMSNVLADLEFAVNNIRENDGNNYLNKYVAAAFASRFMLFEGTWYNYHAGSGSAELSKTFLQAAVKFAEIVMNSGNYAFDTDFRSLFGSEKQVGTETLMFREYSAALSITHCIASYSNLDENQSSSANLSLLKAWICQDGKPYTSSTVDNVASWRLQDMAVTRDPRFEATFWSEPHSGNTGVYCVKFIDREGPTYALDASLAEGKVRPPKYGSMTNTNGFPVMRLAEVVLNWIEAKAELAYHHGGAAVTQDDIDKSINAIRLRPLDAEAIAKGVKQTAPLVLANLEDDPARTSSVEANTLGGVCPTPLLWEIRRERRMEFYLEQYRTNDIRRWGKLELMQGATNPDILVGGWVDFNNTKNLQKKFNLLTADQFGNLKVQKLDGTVVTFDGEADEDGNILSSNAADMVGFRIPNNIQDRDPVTQRNYLEPICTDILDEYAQKGYPIEQNPGW
ncbi:MAG: RagB/SusD family nutrient uptake outer membrane protein [Bacteroidales bacterium]|nr:RagB/SusD family nutrient uptake outer membrane protein [Bacteroidales bacterium]